MYIIDGRLHLPDYVVYSIKAESIFETMISNISMMDEDDEITEDHEIMFLTILYEWKKGKTEPNEELILNLLYLSYMFSLLITKKGFAFLNKHRQIAYLIKKINMYVVGEYDKDMCNYFRKKFDCIETVEYSNIDDYEEKLIESSNKRSKGTQTDPEPEKEITKQKEPKIISKKLKSEKEKPIFEISEETQEIETKPIESLKVNVSKNLDIINKFFESTYEFTDEVSDKVKKSDVYSAFKLYCADNKRVVLGRNSFYEEFEKIYEDISVFRKTHYEKIKKLE
jgi:hypothetical protein